MKKLVLKTTLLMAAALALPMPANAVPTLVDPSELLTGVNGLVVDGVTYDVTFSVVAEPDQSGAPGLDSSLAATALADFFKTQAITSGELFYTQTNFIENALNIWLDYSLSFTTFGGNGVSSSYRYGGNALFPYGYYNDWTVGDGDEFGLPLAGSLRQSYPFDTFIGIHELANLINVSATFQAAPIPEPETYALMLAGLAMVGAAVRRRRARA